MQKWLVGILVLGSLIFVSVWQVKVQRLQSEVESITQEKKIIEAEMLKAQKELADSDELFLKFNKEMEKVVEEKRVAEEANLFLTKEIEKIKNLQDVVKKEQTELEKKSIQQAETINTLESDLKTVKSEKVQKLMI